MPSHSHHHGSDIDLDSAIVIVVGAHPHAEAFDRPLAHSLRNRVVDWQALQSELIFPLQVIVCTDLWYLNDATMMSRPTIAMGRPGVNAATAYFANRLPASFAVADLVHMHFDPEFIEHTICLWGRNEEATRSACNVFAERYLASFMHSVHLLPTPDD